MKTSQCHADIILADHIGYSAFRASAERYEKLCADLANCYMPILLSQKVAADAYVEDNSGWWAICKKENLFPFGHVGNGDLLTLQPQNDIVAIVVVDLIEGSKVDWLFESKFPFSRFLDQVAVHKDEDTEWLYAP